VRRRKQVLESIHSLGFLTRGRVKATLVIPVRFPGGTTDARSWSCAPGAT
jgi:hypothetical protein